LNLSPWGDTVPMTAFAPMSAQALEAMPAADASGSQELNSTAPEMSEPAKAGEAGGTELPESAGGPAVEQALAAMVATMIAGL
jgi:hypothetical protein